MDSTFGVFMIEIGMCLCLTIMGIYFFKSTELPKELRERSAQFSSESSFKSGSNQNKINFTPRVEGIISNEKGKMQLSQMSQLKKAADQKNLNDEIDKLTITITTLEQEIKENNARNSEIQLIINANLARLEELQLLASSLLS